VRHDGYLSLFVVCVVGKTRVDPENFQVLSLQYHFRRDHEVATFCRVRTSIDCCIVVVSHPDTIELMRVESNVLAVAAVTRGGLLLTHSAIRACGVRTRIR
jgi:hypothetical protein